MLMPLVVKGQVQGGILVVFNFGDWLENINFGAGAEMLSNLEMEIMFGREIVYEATGFATTGACLCKQEGKRFRDGI